MTGNTASCPECNLFDMFFLFHPIDKMKDAVIAKLANQAADFYGDAFKQCQYKDNLPKVCGGRTHSYTLTWKHRSALRTTVTNTFAVSTVVKVHTEFRTLYGLPCVCVFVCVLLDNKTWRVVLRFAGLYKFTTFLCSHWSVSILFSLWLVLSCSLTCFHSVWFLTISEILTVCLTLTETYTHTTSG